MRLHGKFVLLVAVPLAACGGSHLAELPPAPVYSGGAHAYAPPTQGGPGPAAAEPAPVSPSDPLPPGVTAAGPRGTSQEAAGAARYDAVGYAGWYEAPRLGVAHATLPIGSFVELTLLDTGKTVLLPVVERMGETDKIVGLSNASARVLGINATDALAVRVRRVVPSAMDQHALETGQPAAARPDTPPVLLVPLRNRLPRLAAAPVRTVPRPPTARAVAPRPGSDVGGEGPPTGTGARYAQPGRPANRGIPAPRVSPAHGAGIYVQVATLASRGNAEALAGKLGARVSPVGRLWRVRLGPFADAAQATRARDAAARRGYGDARILRED